MPQQKFTSISTYSDPAFHSSIKMEEFWRGTFESFNRTIKSMSTTNDHLVITLSDDIPNSDGSVTPFFEPEYYGFTRG